MPTEIEQIASQYSHLAAAFAQIPQGTAHLQRLQDLNASWQNMLCTDMPRQYAEVIFTKAGPAVPAYDIFDITYAGGGLNVLNAAVMARRYGLRVLIFDRFTVGAVHREWNISREELQELLDIGLLTPSELTSVIQREYSDGLVRFHPTRIRVPPTELHLKDVLNVAIDAEKLTALCMRKIVTQPSGEKGPNVILHHTTFMHCSVQPGQGVTVDVIQASGEQHSYRARLLVDGMGATSPIACQLNCGRPFSLVCPTVGTVARGYKNGSAFNEINPEVGEVLVSTEDVRNGRQLIWEAFPGVADQVAIYLFYYAETSSQVNLLQLFEDFFTLLPCYKDSSTVEIIKPVYGFIPSGYNISLPWQRERKVLAYDHILSLGDAVAFQSPLTFCGFGSCVRNLRRITTLLDQALKSNCLRAEDLNHIRAFETVPAVARAFSKFMIAKPGQPPWQVNETLNVFCRVLQNLDPRITNDFFKDRVSWRDYTSIVLHTPRYYPKIYTLAFKTLTSAEMLGWVTAWLKLSLQSIQYRIYLGLKPLVQSLFGKVVVAFLSRTFPHVGLRLIIWLESMEQIGRGRFEKKKCSKRDNINRVRAWGLGYWLGKKWPHA